MNEVGLAQRLTALLQELDACDAATSETKIFESIKALYIADEEICPEFVAEQIAFQFNENDAGDRGNRDTYFAPMAILTYGDGSVIEAPDAKQITEDMISYWARRGNESTNELLKARYLGLVWEFSRQTTGSAACHLVGRDYIDNLLAVAENDLDKYPISTAGKLERALSVAMSLNDPELKRTCKDTILRYESRISADVSRPGVEGLSYDLLVKDNKGLLSEEEEAKIISDLELELDTLASPAEGRQPNPWDCERAAERLAGYYRTRDKADDVVRVLGLYEAACQHVSEQAAPMLAHSLYRRLYDAYMHFGLRARADSVAVILRRLGPEMEKDMKEISHSVEIPAKEMRDYVEAITDGSVEQAIARLVSRYLPRQDDIRDQLSKAAKEAVFFFLISRDIHDSRGRLVARVGSLDEDPDGHIVLQMDQNMAISASFLNAVLIRFVERHNMDSSALAQQILKAPIFLPERAPIIERGLEAYLASNHLSAAHILIPQIENAIRELVEMQNAAVMKSGHNGGFLLRTLDDLLRDPVVGRVLGDDMVLYLRVLLTDQRGWNLRNSVCHGILPSQAFHKGLTDRLVHVLLCLSLVRTEEDAPE